MKTEQIHACWLATGHSGRITSSMQTCGTAIIKQTWTNRRLFRANLSINKWKWEEKKNVNQSCVLVSESLYAPLHTMDTWHEQFIDQRFTEPKNCSTMKWMCVLNKWKCDDENETIRPTTKLLCRKTEKELRPAKRVCVCVHATLSTATNSIDRNTYSQMHDVAQRQCGSHKPGTILADCCYSFSAIIQWIFILVWCLLRSARLEKLFAVLWWLLLFG